MYLSRTAEYALRAMAHIASLDAGEAITSRDLSEVTDIPVHYLSKILRLLVVAGLLKSRRGHGGGFALARPADQIRFFHVLQATDKEPDLDHCAFGREGCDHAKPCRLHTTWGPLKRAVSEWAQSMTLADTFDQAS